MTVMIDLEAVSSRDSSSKWSQIERYTNEELCLRFVHKLHKTRAEAEELFADVKKFLFLASEATETVVPSKAIDEGWHEFLMYTADYAAFCRKHLGHFVHHRPESYVSQRIDRGAGSRTIELAMAKFGSLSANWLPSHVRVAGTCDDFNCSSCDDDVGGQDGNGADR